MDKQRLNILALSVFMFSAFMLWDSWQKEHNPPAPAAATTTANGVPAAPNGSVPSATPAASTVPAANVAKTTVQTDLFKAEISAQGGDLIFLELEKHPATLDKTKNFVLFDNDKDHTYIGQSGLIGDGLPNHKTVFSLEKSEYSLADGQDTLSVRLSAPAGGGLKVTKVYTFKRGSYLIDVGYELSNVGKAPIAPFAYFQILRDGKTPDGQGHGMFSGVSTFTGPVIYTDADKYQKIAFSDIDKGKAKYSEKANDGWVGLAQHYFFSAWLPQGQSPRDFYVDKVGELYRAGFKYQLAAIAPGQTASVTVPMYAGPQELDKIEKIAPGLKYVVDYGRLTIIAAPLFSVMEFIHSFIGNWGWTIIVLTMLLKLIFFPLSAASYKSMAKMRAVMPQMTRLKEIHKDDKAKLNQEMMELYKREKINPLGGCLPVVVQIPVFLSLYWVLLGTVQMRNAPWLGWITDLSAPDTLFGMIPFVHMPIGPLPLLMGVTMFLQSRLNPTPPDPVQAKVMTWMPVMFTVMFLSFPAGLVLYWTVNNLLSITQQWFITRQVERGTAK